jgi:hypothetical protein
MSRATIWQMIQPIFSGHGDRPRRPSTRPKRLSSTAWPGGRRRDPAPTRSVGLEGNPYLGRECEEESCRLLDPISEIGDWGIVELNGQPCLFCKWCSNQIGAKRKGSGVVARVAIALGQGEVHQMNQPLRL